MNRDRLETLNAWREAAQIERDALAAARDQIDALIERTGAEDYPRSVAIDSEIEQIDRSTLALLVSWQNDVRDERQTLLDARDALDDDTESVRFSSFTREIARADEEILARAEEIETLAALANV